jgi:hypothetical protein
MKPKMQHQIHQNQVQQHQFRQKVQPREIAPPRNAPVRIIDGEVREEIQNFLQAVNSYPARVAKEPGISFQQHLSSIFAARNDNEERDRRESRPRRN